MDWSALFNNIGNLLKKNTPVTPTTIVPAVTKELPKTPVILEPTITVSTQEVIASVTTNIPVVEVAKQKQYIITKEQLKAICPTANLLVVEAINKLAPKYGITTKIRMAAFLAQTIHESNSFHAKRESFAYKPARLAEVFHTRIASVAEAKSLLAKGPVAVAEKVYGGRNGNGVNNGDGYRYRGGGYMQTTFYCNYKDLSDAIGIDLIKNPELITTDAIALESAMVFWKNNNLNALADKGNIDVVSKKVNGGKNGLEERRDNYNKAMKVLT